MVRRSIVFTDIVGSTSHLETFGDERWAATLATLDTMVAGLVAASGGTVVKGLGDGHLLTFTEAGTALRFAQELLSSASHLRVLEHSIELRIGVHLGEILEDRGDIHGRSVHAAARIGALAGSGEVLCSRPVVEAAGEKFRFGPARTTPLRGLDGLFDLHLLLDPGDSTVEVRSASPRGLLDRGRECAQLDTLLERASGGRGGFGVIEAAPGMGKSALMRFAAERAASIGLRVLSARGDELETNYPFGIVMQALSAAASAASQEELFSDEARFARAVLEGATTDVTSSDGHRERHALLSVCLRLARTESSVVLVDDAHWSDIASLEWIAQLARRLGGEPLSVVVATRPTQEGDHGRLLRRLYGEAGAERIAVRPLSDDGVRTLIAARLAATPGDEFVAACVGATGGNPFLVSELLRSLADDTETHDASAIQLRSSAGLGRVVLARLAPLGPAAQSLAAAVAVLPRQAPLRHAAVLAELNPTKAAEAADALTGAGVLAEGRPVDFIHPLTRQTIYEEIAPARRNALHRKAMDILLAESAPHRDVAAHAMFVEPAADQTVAAALINAAAQARSVGALDSAATFLRRALSEPPDAASRDQTRLDLGEIEFMLGAYDEGVATLTPLVDHHGSDERTFLAAVHALTECYGYGLHQWSNAARAIEDAMANHGEPSSDAYLWLESRRYFYAQTLGDDSADHARLAAAVERIAGPGRGAAGLLNQYADSLLTLGTASASEIAAIMQRALDYDPEIAYLSVLTDAERPDLVVPIAKSRLARAEQDGSRPAQALNHRILGEALWARGDLREACLHIRQAYDLTGGRNAIAVVWLGTLLFELGKADEAGALLDERTLSGPWQQAATSLGNASMSSPLWHLRARLALDAGDLERAAEEFERTGRDLQWAARVQDNRQFELLLRQGNRAGAAALTAELVGSAVTFAASSRLGLALSAASRCLSTADDAVEQSGEALIHLRTGPDRAALAEGLLYHGEALRRAQHLRRSREVLAGARELAVGCGAHHLVERIAAEQRIAGARPRRDALSGIDALTAAEQRVAALAAAGRSNGEIAGELVLSVRTVEMHLSRAYRKLGVTGRRDLSTALGA